MKLVRFTKCFFTLCMLLLCSCALFLGDEDPVHKDSGIRFVPPKPPFQKINAAGADSVWQSEVTGNTIAVNSTCMKNDNRDLKTLEQNILLGVEHLKIRNEREVKLDGRPAQRVLAEGKSDGVPIIADLLILKKGDCTYDLDYIAKTQSFDKERDYFEKFISGFSAP